MTYSPQHLTPQLYVLPAHSQANNFVHFVLRVFHFFQRTARCNIKTIARTWIITTEMRKRATTVKVYDVTAIKVKNVNNGTVGKPVVFLGKSWPMVTPGLSHDYDSYFTVETSQAGPGNLEVTVNGGRVPTSAQAQGQHTYAISFTPREAQNHTVELRFNGQDVPGSPFTCKVMFDRANCLTEFIKTATFH